MHVTGEGLHISYIFLSSYLPSIFLSSYLPSYSLPIPHVSCGGYNVPLTLFFVLVFLACVYVCLCVCVSFSLCARSCGNR